MAQARPDGRGLVLLQDFLSISVPWSWSFAHIGEHFHLEDKLYSFWKEQCPDQILEVPYEELVSNPRTWIPKILAHCRLEEEEQVFEPQNNKRAVVTASVMQVQSPINESSIGASIPYHRYMHDFVSAYEEG